jgi:hypothetical protein
LPRTKREEIAAFVGLLAMLEGVLFDMGDFRRRHYNKNLVTRVVKALVESGVLKKVRDRRNYVLTERFLGILKEEIRRKTPVSGIHQFPSLDVFDVGGIENWTEHDLDVYVEEMRKLRCRLSGKKAA